MFLVRLFINFVFGYLADKKGRKYVIVITFTIGTISVVLMGIIYQYYTITLIFYAGLGCLLPHWSFSSLYIMEHGDVDFKNLTSTTLLNGYCIFEILIIVIAFFVTDWKYLMSMVLGIPFVIFWSGLFLIKESPLYLLE